jgi:hypothetical protein
VQVVNGISDTVREAVASYQQEQRGSGDAACTQSRCRSPRHRAEGLEEVSGGAPAAAAQEVVVRAVVVGVVDAGAAGDRVAAEDLVVAPDPPEFPRSEARYR